MCCPATGQDRSICLCNRLVTFFVDGVIDNLFDGFILMGLLSENNHFVFRNSINVIM